MRTIVFAVLTLFVSVIHAAEETPGAPPAIYMSVEDLDTALSGGASAANAAGAAVTISPGISVRRRSSSVPQYAVMHPYSVEIYRILEGSGTLVTGGLLELPLADSPSANVVRSEHGIKGGLARQVKAGDILVLQPGTPHWFSSIDGESLTYMESRIQIATHPVQYQ